MPYYDAMGPIYKMDYIQNELYTHHILDTMILL